MDENYLGRRALKTYVRVRASSSNAARVRAWAETVHAASGGTLFMPLLTRFRSRKLGLDVAALATPLHGMHGAAHDAFVGCVRRLKRGAHRGFPSRSLSAATAELCVHEHRERVTVHVSSRWKMS